MSVIDGMTNARHPFFPPFYRHTIHCQEEWNPC